MLALLAESRIPTVTGPVSWREVRRYTIEKSTELLILHNGIVLSRDFFLTIILDIILSLRDYVLD